MLVRISVSLALMAGGVAASSAATIQLKENVSIVGKVLAEKADFVVVDLGFDVLSVPRTHILQILEKAEVPGEEADLASLSASRDTLFVASSSQGPERLVRDLVGNLGEAVVQVRTPSGLGSGFIINEEGYLITNFHVIEGESQFSVEVYHNERGQLERRSYKEVRIVAMNKFQDLALLKIEDEDAPEFVKVPLGDSDALAVGERVFAIGSPLGLERTVTEGILSTKTRQFQGGLYLQTTTQINPGNSGGPLFNLRGEVMGITNMKLNFVEGIGFAIPVEAVKYFLKHRDAFAYDNDNPSNAYHYLAPPSRGVVSGEESESAR